MVFLRRGKGVVVAVLTALATAVHAEAGTVVAISDGDTLTVLLDREQIKVRLAEIDAPEKRQPFGTRSRQSLAELCFQKSAELKVVDVDRYSRTVARVYCDGVDANAEQVRRGMAWVYTKYSTDPALPSLQSIAKASGAGLWAEPKPVPPWEFRKLKRRPQR